MQVCMYKHLYINIHIFRRKFHLHSMNMALKSSLVSDSF